jgi:hypothetical protein
MRNHLHSKVDSEIEKGERKSKGLCQKTLTSAEARGVY